MSFVNSLTKMCTRIEPGLCRIGMNGTAIKTSDGYKTYNVDSGTLVNCSEFVFDIGEDMFFVIPTNDVQRGDIVLNGGKPACVIEVGDKTIMAMDYESSTIITMVPQRHVFFGNTYFYAKIVSLFEGFGNNVKGMGMEQMMGFAMMSEVCKSSGSDMGKMLPMMVMGGMMNGGFNMGNMFGGMMSAPSGNDVEEDA